jgi:hypothetical protein
VKTEVHGRRHGKRRLGVAAVLLGCALVTACTDGRASEPDSPPTPVATPTATPTPTPTPTPLPVDEEEARLEELRASDAFLEFAEHDRAQTAQWARFAYDEFTLSSDDAGVRAEWTNKDELWDELMPPFRDECLLAGPVATRPIWDGQIMIPVGMAPRWSNKTTEGRGQFLEASCAFVDGESEEVVELWVGFLIQTAEDSSGRVVRQLEPFDFRESQASTYAEQDEQISEHFWAWITEEPEV